ncbi:cell adhesion molecule CEACAM8-like [Lissotriton helveticus]
MVISLKSWRPSGRVHGGWGWIHTAWVTSVWVTSLLQCTAAQLSITPDVVTAAVGDNVTLSVRYEGRFRYCNWYRGGGTDAKDQIFGLFDSDAPPFYGSGSTGRESVLPDGSLRITDVQTDHSGNYTVRMRIDPRGLQEATAQLRVHAPEAGGNKIRTSTPMIVSIPERGAPPASDASCSSWWVTLAVASGMLLGAVVAVLGVVLFYERRAKKANGATPGCIPRAIYESEVNYENMEKGNQAQPAAQSPDADRTYMALKHGDQATYGHL